MEGAKGTSGTPSGEIDQIRHMKILSERRSTLLTQNSLGSLKGIMQFRTISKTNPLLADRKSVV